MRYQEQPEWRESAPSDDNARTSPEALHDSSTRPEDSRNEHDDDRDEADEPLHIASTKRKLRVSKTLTL